MKTEFLHCVPKVGASDIPNTQPTASVGFWKRQFQSEPTKLQRKFDWAYGFIIPLICVAADPIVFTRTGLLGEYQLFAYVLSATSIMIMAAWLLWGEKLRWLAAPLAGLFVAGSAVSLTVGVVILPYSLLGLLIFIGFLGLTPLFSAIVYLRNGVRALRASGAFLDRRTAWHAAGLTAILAFVVPYLFNAYFAF